MALTWQADSAVSECFLCQAPYTLFNRRHHCRRCGRVVCAACSSQNMRFSPDTAMVSAEGHVERAQPSQWYRVCDECAAAARVRRVPAAGGAGRASTPGSSSDVSTGKYDPTTTHTRPADSPASGRPIGDADSDDHLCPVCGTDLERLFRGATAGPGFEPGLATSGPGGATSGLATAGPGFEPGLATSGPGGPSSEAFKKAHISDCLTAYDFASDHARLSSPPDGRTARNRMLVYNMPPIPAPKYESLQQPANSPAAKEAASATSQASLAEKPENECVICLDELRAGDKVGRLECLCVFHYQCIKDWFNKKSYAECPVHYLHR